jgi:CHASE1-domain containing sensor protein
MSQQPRLPFNGWSRAVQIGTLLSTLIAIVVAISAWNHTTRADATAIAEAQASVRHEVDGQIAGLRSDLSVLEAKVDLLLQHFSLVPKESSR